MMESYGYVNVLNLLEEMFQHGLYIPVEMIRLANASGILHTAFFSPDGIVTYP